jgi:hypothetical protein
MRYQPLKPASIYEAGLIILVSPIAINFAWIWITGFDGELEWLIGNSGESRVLK